MQQLLLTEPESIEREAYGHLFTGAGSPDLRRRLALSAEPCGSALVLRSRVLDHVLFNRAFGLERSAPDGDALADSVVARYRAQHIARYVVQVTAGTEPCVTCERLHALGLRREPRRWHKLARGPGVVKAESDALHVERTEAADTNAIAGLLVNGFELPDAAVPLFAHAAQNSRWHAYVARGVEDEPYATLLMYAHAERAHLTLAGTDRRQRRRGAQRALIARAVRDALDLGCREISAEAPEAAPAYANASHHNLVHAGFEVVEVRDTWAPTVGPSFG